MGSRVLAIAAELRRDAEAFRRHGQEGQAEALATLAERIEHAHRIDQSACYERILNRPLTLKGEAAEATGIPYTTLNDMKRKNKFPVLPGVTPDTALVRDLPCAPGFLAKLIGAPGREPVADDADRTEFDRPTREHAYDRRPASDENVGRPPGRGPVRELSLHA